MNLTPQNTGLVIEPIRPTDWKAEGVSGVTKVVLKGDGQYDLYLPDEERQAQKLFDSRACVTFSATDLLETIFNLKLATNALSPAQIAFLKNEGYVDPFTGKVNFSDRFTAKLSGTTPDGNNFAAVGDSIRKDGLLPEKEWPWPVEIVEDPTAEGYQKNWNIYYKEIPQALKDKAKRFLQHFQINYEWTFIQGSGGNVVTAIKQALPNGPVQIGVQICAPWSSNEGEPPIQACGCTPHHAIEVYGENEVQAHKVFDSYKSFRKLLASDYCIPYAFQYFVTDPAPAGQFTKDLSTGMDDPQVKLLQVYLNAHGFPVAASGAGSPGKETTFFGGMTTLALRRFQTKQGISPALGYFGPKTRAFCNANP